MKKTMQDILDTKEKLERAKQFMKYLTLADCEVYAIQFRNCEGLHRPQEFFGSSKAEFFGLSKAGFFLQAITDVLKDVGFNDRLMQKFADIEKENLNDEVRLMEERHIQITQEMLRRN